MSTEPQVTANAPNGALAPVLVGFALLLVSTPGRAAPCAQSDAFGRHLCELKRGVKDDSGCDVEQHGYALAKMKLSKRQQRLAIPVLVSGLSLDDDQWRECSPWSAMQEALGAIGAPAVAELVKKLKTKQVIHRRGVSMALAERAIARHAGRFIPELVAALDEPDAVVAGSLQSCLVELMPRSLVALRRALHHRAARVREHAAQALLQIGPPAGSAAVPDLIPLLEDPNGGVRSRAVDTLARLKAAAAVGPLLTLLKKTSKVWWLRKLAEAFGEIGPPARGAVPALKKLARHADKSVRAAASKALAAIGRGRRRSRRRSSRPER